MIAPSPLIQKIQRYRLYIALFLFGQAFLKSLTFGFGIGILWTWGLSFTANPPSASLHSQYFYYVCLLALMMATAYTLYWKPTLFRTCRYLDQKEQLHDQLTTAYQIEGKNVVEQLVQQRANTLFPQKKPRMDLTYLLLASLFFIVYVFSPPLQQAIQKQQGFPREEQTKEQAIASLPSKETKKTTPPEIKTVPTITIPKKEQTPLPPLEEPQVSPEKTPLPEPESSEQETEEKENKQPPKNPSETETKTESEPKTEKSSQETSPEEKPSQEPIPEESGEKTKNTKGEEPQEKKSPSNSEKPLETPEPSSTESEPKGESPRPEQEDSQEGKNPEQPNESTKKPLGFLKKEIKPLFSDQFFREKTIHDWIQSGQVEVDAEVLKVFPGAETLYLQEGFPLYFQDLIRTYWELLEKDALKRVEKR